MANLSTPLAVQLSGLSKFYGSVRGVVDLDLEVHTGEVFGYLGPNGAGKTTTIRVLLDLLRPTSGSATVLGLDSVADAIDIKRRVGYLPGELALYDNMTGLQLLEYFGSLRGGIEWPYARALAERLDFDPSMKIKEYSSGNRQKLGLIQAFVSRPELLILDEPTSGLDPLMQQTFLKMVDEVREEGRTVFLSSHDLPEVEAVADRVAIIREGVLVTVSGIAELRTKAMRRIQITFANNVPIDEFANLPGVGNVSALGSVMELSVEGTMDRVIKAASGHEVLNFRSAEADLEDVFLNYYRGQDVQ
ncbi:MAG: ABC transporter ATP-binding protein [Acidimicrobiia bacterium]